jgi:hypothetical protein
METWTPLETYLWCVLSGALGGIGSLLKSSEPLSPRSIVSVVIEGAGLGSGLVIICYATIPFVKRLPIIAVAFAGFVGLGAISIQSIRIYLARILNVPHES